MKNTPKISIIICSYNRDDVLADNIHSFIKDKTDPNVYEIVVVDNNSTDNTESLMQSIIAENPGYQIKYIKELNQGASHARNRGIRDTKAPLVAFADDDVIAGENLIAEWLNFFEEYPDAVGLGGRIKVQFDAPRPKWMPEILMTLFGKHYYGKKEKKYTGSQYPYSGNTVYKRSILDKSGLFNTEMGRKGGSLDGGEEKELFFRIAAINDRVYYVPQAYLWHRVGEKRLTQEYVKGQAVGIGKSIAIMLNNESVGVKLKKWITEIVKLLVSLAMALGYVLMLRPAKAMMLLKFRKWVWQGYFMGRKEL